MLKNGTAPAPAARSKRRKWVRHERMYSNAMWHAGLHAMKDPRFCGYDLVTYLDDASRCVTGAAVFEHATSENAALLLRLAITRFGKPASILPDSSPCFVGCGGRRKGTAGTRAPSIFEEELLCHNIILNSGTYRPRASGKLERFHRSLEDEIWNYRDLDAYIDYYNEQRLHFSLDIDNYETPLMAFKNKRPSHTIRKNDPKWMERECA